MEEKFSLENDIRVSAHFTLSGSALRWKSRLVDEEELWKGLKKALDGAVEQFVETRTLEGENLKKDLIEKLDPDLLTAG